LWKAREAIKARAAVTVRYELNDDFADENGLVCGGQMEVFIEPIESAPALYVFGAGHVGYYLGRMAQEAGFELHVVDDRAQFANRERFPDAADIVVDDIPDWLARTTLPPTAYAVIVTRGHRHDLDALRALAPRDLRYIGLIGSRAKVARLYEGLLAEGAVSPEALARVHAPIGLDLGAVTPQEIAVSILAELIAVRRGRSEAIQAASLRWMPKIPQTQE
ncbi:MAG: XdhC family protein, partial [Vicinamibacterales bacterium]